MCLLSALRNQPTRGRAVTPTDMKRGRFSLEHKVGEGTHGVVYRTVDNDRADSETQVAVKRMRPSRGSDGVSITAYREMILLRSLRHDNVVRMIGATVTREVDDAGEERADSSHDRDSPRPVLNLIFEHVAGGDLAQHLRGKRRAGTPFAPATIATLIRQLLSGLAYLHAQDVMHRDIKPANLLVDGPPTWRLRIADFGLARKLVPPPLTSHAEHVVVTLWYRAPEVLLGARTYATSIDLWSTGCILAEVLTLTPMLPGKELPNGEPLQKEQLLLLFQLLGTPARAAWPAVEETRHWAAVMRWPEIGGVGIVVDAARSLEALVVRERPLRPTDAPAPSAEWHTSSMALLTSLLSYAPERRPTAEGALLDDRFRPFFAA